jgi:hypothetical protein
MADPYNIEDYDNRQVGETRKGNWLQTAGGRQYWPMDPRPDEIFITDIAHAGSNICRYNGHTLRFYSVCEHAVYVSMVIEGWGGTTDEQFIGLMHDSPESYIHDLIRPIKHEFKEYKAIERLNWIAVATRYNMPLDMPDIVKRADNAVLLAEKDQIMGPAPADWSVPGEAAKICIHGVAPDVAKGMFLRRFQKLYHGA